jgi:uridine kinase
MAVVGIAGGTGAGKSAMVRGLAKCREACVLEFDSYYLDRSEVAAADRHRLNYDEPAAIDIDLLMEHLGRLQRGLAVETPVYSFATHTRVGVEVLAPAPLVIIEGLFTLWWEVLRSRLDLKIFVDAPADLRLVRRIRRDIAERGRSVAEVLEQYIGAVRPMHERYVEPLRAHADVVIINDGAVAVAVERLAAALPTAVTGGRAR